MEVTSQRTFVLGACLGKGGFGEVYRATMKSSSGLDREVAVKLLRPDLDLGDDAVRRLRDEGRVLAKLDHPGILLVHDLVELGGRVALITEFVDGEDLSSLIKARMPMRAALQAVGQAASALEAAWTAPLGTNGGPLRLAHRDIKPGNLRVSRHGQLKVLDFGIARSDQMTREARTATDLIIGSPAYMAPERFLDTEVRSASDVFALGCVLYEAITGQRLYKGVSAMVQSTMALDEERYEAFMGERVQLDGMPSGVAELIASCLVFDPEARPTCAALARRCEALADEVGGMSLYRWSRDREWETGALVRGSLDGAVLTEGSLALPRTSQGAADDTPTRRSGLLWLGGGAAVAGLVLLVVAVLAAAGVGAWQAGVFGAPATVDAEVPGPTPPARPDTALPVPAAPAPSIEPEPVAPAPTRTAPEPRPRVAPAAPAPEPDPVAAVVPAPVISVTRAPDVEPEPPAAVPTGTVELSGGHPSVALVRGGDRVEMSAGRNEVAAGTWETRSANPTVAPLGHLTITVPEGGTVRVSCHRSLSLCRVR